MSARCPGIRTGMSSHRTHGTYWRLVKSPAIQREQRSVVPVGHPRSWKLLLICLLASATLSTAQSEPNAPKYFFVLLKRPSNAPQLSKEAGDAEEWRKMESQ